MKHSANNKNNRQAHTNKDLTMKISRTTSLFDIFIIEIEQGLSYDDSETNIKLITPSAERAQEEFDKLNSIPHNGWEEYAIVRLIGSISDVNDTTQIIEFKSIELSDEITSENNRIVVDSDSDENQLHHTLWQHECALARRNTIKSSFRDLNLNALN